MLIQNGDEFTPFILFLLIVNRWFDPDPVASTNLCTTDETQPQYTYTSIHSPALTPHPGASPVAPHPGPGALQSLTPQHRTDAAAAQVLMSLGTSPLRKQQDYSTDIKDLLIEEE